MSLRIASRKKRRVICVETSNEILTDRPFHAEQFPWRRWRIKLYEVMPDGRLDQRMPFVRQAVFRLHEDFERANRCVDQWPFMVEEIGWGGFEMPIALFFHGDEPPPFVFVHDLRFDTNSYRSAIKFEYEEYYETSGSESGKDEGEEEEEEEATATVDRDAQTAMEVDVLDGLKREQDASGDISTDSEDSGAGEQRARPPRSVKHAASRPRKTVELPAESSTQSAAQAIYADWDQDLSSLSEAEVSSTSDLDTRERLIDEIEQIIQRLPQRLLNKVAEWADARNALTNTDGLNGEGDSEGRKPADRTLSTDLMDDQQLRELEQFIERLQSTPDASP